MTDAAPIPLQTEQSQTIPGGGVRMLSATVTINGVATPVLMQVVTTADASGALMSDRGVYEALDAILDELRRIHLVLLRSNNEPDLLAGPDPGPGI